MIQYTKTDLKREYKIYIITPWRAKYDIKIL